MATRYPYPEREVTPRVGAGGVGRWRGAVTARSGEDIRRDVETALFYDGVVSSLGIQVEVRDGVVTLRGTVDSEHAREHAEEDARAVPGVRQVINLLTVRPA